MEAGGDGHRPGWLPAGGLRHHCHLHPLQGQEDADYIFAGNLVQRFIVFAEMKQKLVILNISGQEYPSER